jgi:hypothetical protein
VAKLARSGRAKGGSAWRGSPHDSRYGPGWVQQPGLFAFVTSGLRSRYGFSSLAELDGNPSAFLPMHMIGALRSLWRGLLRHLDAEPAVLAAAARARSLQLLADNLSSTQYQQFARRSCFEVTGGVTGKRYRIGTAQMYNFALLDERGDCEYLLCFAPTGAFPLGDVLLAQKLALELYETDVLRVANKCPLVSVGWEPTSLRPRLAPQRLDY